VAGCPVSVEKAGWGGGWKEVPQKPKWGLRGRPV